MSEGEAGDEVGSQENSLDGLVSSNSSFLIFP